MLPEDGSSSNFFSILQSLFKSQMVGQHLAGWNTQREGVDFELLLMFSKNFSQQLNAQAFVSTLDKLCWLKNYVGNLDSR